MRGPSRTTRPWLPWLLLGLLPAPLGWAQAPAAPPPADEPPPAEPPPPPAPVFTFVGFQDLSARATPVAPDCPAMPVAPGGAMQRTCVERVHFVDPSRVDEELDPKGGRAPSQVKEDRHGRRVQRARWKNTSRLTLEAWEVLAYRWNREGDIIRQTLEPLGYTTMPSPSREWSATRPIGARSSRGAGTVAAIPETSIWLGPERWVRPPPGVGAQDRARVEVIFPDVRYRLHGEDGREEVVEKGIFAADFVRLDGRFALRLGADGKTHDYDVMDASRKDSKPFFEQFYPFSGAAARSPLQAFNALPAPDQTPDQLLGLDAPVLLGAPWPGTRRDDKAPKAAELEAWREMLGKTQFQWEQFYYTIAVDVARFALEDFTENHMRVLTALTTMRSPPAFLANGAGRSRNLVAAAIGQTDRDEDVEKRLDRKALTIEGGLALRYGKLPKAVVDTWLPRLTSGEVGEGETEATRQTLNEFAQGFFGEYLRNPSATVVLNGSGEAELKAWMDEHLRPGRDQERFAADLRASYLQILVSKLEGPEQDQAETYIFLDHINQVIVENLDPNAEEKVKVGPLVEGSAELWSATLGQHGYPTRQVKQGLGAVDPTAICTTRDGRDALNEPTFGPTTVDVFVEGPEGLKSPEDVLVQAWDRLPFMLVDDPAQNLNTRVLESSRLVGLPGERAIYRLRWTLWTGWHLLWIPERLPDGRVRLAARTTAVCDDMVLAPRELVPTLVRAALLESEFTSVDDVRRSDWRAWKEKREARDERKNNGKLDDPDAAVGQADAAARAGKDGAGKAKEGITGAKAMDSDARKDAINKGAAGAIDKLLSTEPKAFEGGGVFDATSEGQAIKKVVRERLDEIADKTNGLLLFVLDTDRTQRQRLLRDLRPKTPYSRIQRGVGWRQDVRTAAWAWFLPPTKAETKPEMFFPAHREADATAGEGGPKRFTTTSWADNRPSSWRRSKTLDWNFQAGLGGFPVRDVYYRCNPDEYIPSSMTNCQEVYQYQTPYSYQPVGIIGRQRSDGLSIDLGTHVAWWLTTRPRTALEAGLLFRLDFITPGPALLEQINNPGAESELVDFSWTLRPQAGFITGMRFAPAPMGLTRYTRTASPWGVPHSGGKQSLGRTQWGARAGFLIGPGFNGLEGTLASELWLGKSVRRGRSPHAPFTPYQPGLLVGPYAQGMFGFLMVENGDVERYLQLAQSWTAVFGVRAQLRMKQRGPALPEAK
jgi:hypothetical protein